MRRADRLFQIVQYLRGGRLTTARDLAEMSRGRTVIGYGSGVKPQLERFFGIHGDQAEHAAPRMREFLQLIPDTEVMAIERTFGAALNKALRGLEQAGAGFLAEDPTWWPTLDILAGWAAGAETMYTDATEFGMQGTGLPGRKLNEAYNNTDFTIVDETDMVDIWQMFVYSKGKYPQAFDHGRLIDTRERRRIELK